MSYCLHSTLLVSPLVSHIILCYRIPDVPAFKEFRRQLIYTTIGVESLRLTVAYTTIWEPGPRIPSVV